MSRQPKKRTIQISLTHDHQFQYHDAGDHSDASSVTLINGDTLVWALDHAIQPRTLQLDFGVVNPFRPGAPVSLRGTDSVKSDAVNFPLQYVGNRILKYSVSLGNGWVDDPDVVPVPSDTFVNADFEPNDGISWTDDTESDITLTPVDMTADATDAGGYAKVTWQWGKGQVDTQPFTLDFLDPIPTGWPKTTTDSQISNGVPAITLYLPVGDGDFRITTTKKDGNETSQDGNLTIT